MKSKVRINKIILCLFLMLLTTLYIVKYRPFGLPDINKQIEISKSVRDHNFTLMGDSFINKIYKKYDTVLFGKYKQGIFGILKSPIEWIVLEKNEYSAILLSKYLLDFSEFDSVISNTVFFNEAFDVKEKEKIINETEQISLLDEEDIAYYFDTNEYYNIKKGFDENFCKTADIPYAILYDNATTTLTKFALSKMFKYYISAGKPMWFFSMLKNGKYKTYEYWLKNEINIDGVRYAKTLNAQGFVDKSEINHKTIGVRPVIIIKLESKY